MNLLPRIEQLNSIFDLERSLVEIIIQHSFLDNLQGKLYDRHIGSYVCHTEHSSYILLSSYINRERLYVRNDSLKPCHLSDFHILFTCADEQFYTPTFIWDYMYNRVVFSERDT